MKMFHVLYGKKLLPLLIFLMLLFSLLSLLSVNVKVVSAVEYPAIYIEPAFTDNKTVSENLTISIKTNYTGADISLWQFTLTYNPLVLHGVNITNGDLITKAKNETATFVPGSFDNTEGKLNLTGAIFFDTNQSDPHDVGSGPGTLAKIIFTVVGYGKTNMTFGRGPRETYLGGWNFTTSPEYPYGQPYTIIDAYDMPDHVQDGSLINIQNLHTVGVPHITAPSQAVVEHDVDINVTVVNGGNVTENGKVTLYYDTTEIGNESFTLDSAEFETFSFSWNTSGLNEGFYTLNATATIPVDEFPSDNWNNATIELKKVHDVAVLNISAPTEADMGEPIAINVTIANNGSFDESVNVTLIQGVWHEQSHQLMNPTVIGSQVKNVLIRGSALFNFSWDASGLDSKPTYTLNATATIPVDEDLSDNWNKTEIRLVLGHNVAVIEIEAPSSLFVGESTSINVTVQNNGKYAEDSVNVTLTYKSALIDTTLIDFQVKNIPKGDSILVQFSWNTSGFAPDTYYLNATATISKEGWPIDNTRFKLIIVNGALITGKVTDALTGNPIEAASIIAGDYSATTDINGTYKITDALPGTYDVTASATGYESASKLGITVIAEAEPTTVNFTLRAISNITISADPANITVGDSITISASLSPIRVDVTITILYRLNGEEAWTELANVTANESGQFVHVWTPETAGTYEIKAEWLGDEKTSPAENSVQVTVEKAPSDIFLYLAIAAIVVVVAGGAIAVYLLKVRKSS